jgi:Zn-finger nucleic acid-binding protein
MGVTMKKKPLTDAQYIINPNVCPSCHSHDVTGGRINIDVQTTQEVTCDTCGATWIDVYQLMGYMELKEKETTENDWRAEVNNGDTRLGYDEWVEHKKEMLNDELEIQNAQKEHRGFRKIPNNEE